MNTSSRHNSDYQSCFIAFLDILGFSQLVSKSEQDAKILTILHDCLHIAGAFPNASAKQIINDESRYRIEFRTQQFSDSVVFYCKESPPAISQLFWMIRYLQDRLWEQGVCLRGAITYGNMYWPTKNEQMVLGPAMIEAYRLEDRSAIYPRILVSDRLRDYIEQKIEQKNIGNGNFLINNRLLSSAVKQDFDGLYFLDLLNPNIRRHQDEKLEKPNNRSRFSIRYFDHEPSNHSQICDQVEQLIENELNENQSEKIRQKYLWLKHYLEQSR